ncbi:hypothetical protein LUZ60_011909 [Juncus effusus]|nr:hypothetical protein LUZ60_011909 [Juncus effusus]
MERLIHSPLPTTKPHLPSPRASSAPKFPLNFASVKPLPSLFLPNQQQRPSNVLSSITPQFKRNETDPFLESKSTTQSNTSFLQKVASASLITLLSSVLLSLLHRPAHALLHPSPPSSLVKSELLTSAWTGFFAGCLHTLSGPDHLAALAPLSIGRSRIESAFVGALWGCGHDAGQVIFGLLFLLLKDRLHIEVIRTWGTRVVGLTLLTIGAMGIREASEMVPVTAGANFGEGNVGIVDNASITAPKKKKIGFATFATGIVHGLQPDALMMVLPALALPSRLAGAAFLGMFLVGTVIAMGSYTVFIGSCTQALKDRIPRITEKLTWAASIVAISMGVAIIVSQFFGFSLY